MAKDNLLPSEREALLKKTGSAPAISAMARLIKPEPQEQESQPTSDLGIFDPLAGPAAVEEEDSPAEDVLEEAPILEPEKEEPAPAESEQKEPAPAPAGLLACPRCGWQHGDELPEVTERDKEEFITSLFGERSFEKPYAYFDRRARFVLRSLPPRADDAVRLAWSMQTKEADKQDVMRALSDPEMSHRYLRIHAVALAYSCSRGGDPVTYPALPVESDTLENCAKELLRRVDMWEVQGPRLLSVLMHAAQRFNRTYAALSAHIGDPDFFVTSAITSL